MIAIDSRDSFYLNSLIYFYSSLSANSSSVRLSFFLLINLLINIDMTLPLINLCNCSVAFLIMNTPFHCIIINVLLILFFGTFSTRQTCSYRVQFHRRQLVRCHKHSGLAAGAVSVLTVPVRVFLVVRLHQRWRLSGVECSPQRATNVGAFTGFYQWTKKPTPCKETPLVEKWHGAANESSLKKGFNRYNAIVLPL